jgi:acyl-CoA synthetase (AMP-forming)/AMP-acid ligase II
MIPSYVHGASATPLKYQTIGSAFDDAAQRFPQRDALIVSHQGVRWTYAELAMRVARLAAGMVALGLEPGDRVGIWAPNCSEWMLTQWAAAKAGLILVNINPAYRLAELEFCLKQVGCRALVTADRVKHSDYLGMLLDEHGRHAVERRAELELPDFASYDLSSLRTGIMAGSPCPEAVMRRVMREMHLPDITICYGMTETSPVSFQSAIDDALERRVSTVGRIHPHMQAKVVDRDGCCVPRGVQGELHTRGYSVMKGYWSEPDKTREVLDDSGWMHTGDLGVIDARANAKRAGAPGSE